MRKYPRSVVRPRNEDLIDRKFSFVIDSQDVNPGLSIWRFEFFRGEGRSAARHPIRFGLIRVPCVTRDLTGSTEIPDDRLAEPGGIHRVHDGRLRALRVALPGV